MNDIESTAITDAADQDSNSSGPEDLPYSISLEITVNDSSLIREIIVYKEGRERDDYVLRALQIGLLTLKQARGQLEAEAVKREGERFLSGLQSALQLHAQEVNTGLTNSLKEYFDPESGRFHERVNRLVKKDGELELLLRQQIGNQDSELCSTLRHHFGEDSPLMKMLSPNEADGLIRVLAQTIDGSLKLNRDGILGEFSLDNKEGALSRLISELVQKHDKLGSDLQGKVGEVVEEFSLDNKDSALSRLVRRVTRAQRTISSEFSLDNENSALSRMSRTLEKTSKCIDDQLTLDKDTSALARLRREMLEILNNHSKSNSRFQEEVTKALAGMQARKAEAQRSPIHGTEFEKTLCDFALQECAKCGDIGTPTGKTIGLIKNCRVGDFVIELGPETLAAGEKIALEAKEEEKYTLQKAREEIETARKNRGAQVGLFVFSKKIAPTGLKPLSRIGSDVFVVWDADDAQTDLYLQVAIDLTKALCHLQAKHQDLQQADFTEIEKAILEIEKRANSLDQMENWTGTIKKSSEKILKRILNMKKALVKQVGILRGTTADLRNSFGSTDSPNTPNQSPPQ